MIGEVAQKQGNFELAIEWISKAIELKPDNPLYLCNRAKQYMKIEDYDNVNSLILGIIRSR